MVRALGFRVEAAQRIDLVVEQFDAVGLVRAHRVQVEQGAAHREVARVQHLGHVAVARGLEAAFFGVEIELLAAREVERIAGDPGRRRQPLHQRGDRHHQHAAARGRQPVQGRHALRDDVRMRAEQVVGQGFPVGEVQHRQIAGQHAQVVFERLGAVAVAGDGQHQALVAAGGLGQAERQRAGAVRRTPQGALLAGLGARRGGKEGAGHGAAEFTAGAAPVGSSPG